MRMTIKDNNGNNKPVNYTGIFPDANMSVNPFGQNRVAEIAYKKTERLVLATYLVTNFVPKNENVREGVRTQAQQLLPLVLALREGLHSAGPESVNTVAAKARHILSLLDVIHASGYISDMNLEVLKGAYVDLVRFLEKSQNETSSESLELTEEHFMSVTGTSNGHISNGQKETVKDKKIKDIQKDMIPVTDKEGKTAPRAKSLRSKRRVTSRRMAILDVVTKIAPAHIKDIALEITDCSEKTIQRELVSLVNDGVLKREGSKRWTTYSVVV